MENIRPEVKQKLDSWKPGEPLEFGFGLTEAEFKYLDDWMKRVYGKSIVEELPRYANVESSSLKISRGKH